MYDVIIVGARCAGSPTAMLLAKEGYRVLLVDRATFPSEQPMSTHFIWPPGVALLRGWGLLDDVEAHCPAVPIADVDLGPFHLTGRFPPCDSDGPSVAYSPRRAVLDHLLVEGAGRSEER